LGWTRSLHAAFLTLPVSFGFQSTSGVPSFHLMQDS
jgi:hypothetical protein